MLNAVFAFQLVHGRVERVSNQVRWSLVGHEAYSKQQTRQWSVLSMARRVHSDQALGFETDGKKKRDPEAAATRADVSHVDASLVIVVPSASTRVDQPSYRKSVSALLTMVPPPLSPIVHPTPLPGLQSD
jgi:hypothetical protein